jgi:hypothetical protein
MRGTNIGFIASRMSITASDIAPPTPAPGPGGSWAHMTKHISNMTKDNFRELCKQVLIPLLGDLLHQQLVEIIQTQDVQSTELIRIGERLDRIERYLADLSEYGKKT